MATTAFVTEEVKIARSTAYNYIDLVSVFGVQTFGRANAPDPSKLIPLLPLLKSKNENIPVDKIKSQFVKEAQNHSARDIKEKAQELKVKYGLAKAAEGKQKPEVDFKQLARDYHFDLSKVKSDLEKIYREYAKLAQKHNILAEKLLKKKDKEKGLFERERARIYSEVSKKLGTHFVFLREILK